MNMELITVTAETVETVAESGATNVLQELIANTDPAKWDWNLSPEIITLIVTNFVMTIAGAEILNTESEKTIFLFPLVRKYIS